MQDASTLSSPAITHWPQHTLVRAAGLLAAAIAVVTYALFIVHQSANIPISDDYRDALGFLEAWQAADNPLAKLQALYAKNNSHVTFTNHVVYWALWTLTGEINFRWVQWIGALNIPALGLVLFMALRQKIRDPALLLACLGLMLFQIQWFEAALWPMTSLSNFSVIVLALAAFYAAGHRPALAIAFALLASWSQLNGLLVWPLLAWQYHRQGIQWQRLLWMAGVPALLACLPYLLIPTVDSALRQWEPSRILPALVMAPFAWLALAGSVFAGLTQVWLALPAGSGVAWASWRTGRRAWQHRDDFIVNSLLFLATSCLLIAIGRYMPGHMELMLQSRYRPYPVLLLVLLLAGYLAQAKATGHSYRPMLALCFALAFNVASWLANIGPAQSRVGGFSTSAELWLMSGRADDLGFNIFLLENPEQYLQPALAQGLYRPQSLLSGKNRPLRVEATHCPAARTYPGLDIVTYANSWLQSRATEITVQDFSPLQEKPPSLLLCRDDGSGYRLVLGIQHWPAIQGTPLRRAKIFLAGKNLGIPAVPAGQYEVRVEDSLDNHASWQGPTHARIDIPDAGQ